MNNIYYSQAGQDIWVAKKFDYKKNGYFLEVGAYDGIQTSNTYFLEKELGWSGICIEANPYVFDSLALNRKSLNLNLAVSNYEGVGMFSGDAISTNGRGVNVDFDTLNNILEKSESPEIIDYLSIDIEGHEFTVLEDFDFSKWHINCMTVEHNLYMNGPTEKEKLFQLLSNKGFIREVEDAPCLDNNPLWHMKPYEDWYVNKNLI